MADEPNKRMDEALKAYAQKRREDAGAPFDLHPATRQMLHGEVARNYKQAPQLSFLQRAVTFWPRITFAAACVAITITILLIAVPRDRVTQVAQSPAESETLTGDAVFSDKEQANESRDRAADRPTAASAPALTPQPLDKLAKETEGDELKAKAGNMSEARKDNDSVRLLREETAKQEVARRSYVNTAQTSDGRYYRQAKNDAQLGVRLEDAQNRQPILNNFEFQQTGNEVLLIDQDGSVYRGNVVSNVEVAKKLNESAQQEPAGLAGAAAASPEQQVMFYAIGTNLSLRQKVSIEANIMQLQTNVANRPAPAAVPPPVQTAEPTQNERLSRQQNAIRGRARLGTNQEYFFEAVPAKP